MPIIPLPASNYRNQPNNIWSAEHNVRPPKVNNASPFLRDYSTTPGVGCGFLYFRSKAVLGLPVSTTSYSRYTVSTIQTWSAGPTTVRSLTDIDGTKTPRSLVLLPYLHILIILVWSQLSILSISNSATHVLEYNYISYLVVTKNYSTSKYPICRECQEITRLLPEPIKHSTSIGLYTLV